MQLFNGFGRKTAFGAAGVVAALAAGGTAYAATSSSPGATGPTAAGPVPAVRRLLQRADHATVEVKVKGQWVTYTLDRGEVTAVSPTSITLTRPDGQIVTDTIGPATKFAGVASEASLQADRRALVVSEGGAALRIRQAPPAPGSNPAAS